MVEPWTNLDRPDIHLESGKRSEFIREVAAIINRLSLEQYSDTPDYLLAELMWESLATYSDAVSDRDRRRG
jgi:hypothetical protein